MDHLEEATFYHPKDLESIGARLSDCRRYINHGKESYSPHLITLLDARIKLCEEVLERLELKISHLTPDLAPKYERLVSILRSLCALNTRSKVISMLPEYLCIHLHYLQFPHAEVDELLGHLKEIAEELRPYGIHAFESTGTKEDKLAEMTEKLVLAMEHPEPAPEAKKLIETLLARCFVWVDKCKTRQGRVAHNFKDIYEKLLGVKNQLEKLSLTHAWSMRETDLYSYQRQLDRIDEARGEDGNFYDALGRGADLYEQRVSTRDIRIDAANSTQTMLYLLRKSYATIYQLLVSSEPVSEALLPIYNQLSTLKKCLLDVKKLGGVSSPRELYPYSMKLNSIDNMRVDGKFMVGDEIPDGQGAVTLLLAECFDLAYELRNEAEDSGSAEKSDGSGDS